MSAPQSPIAARAARAFRRLWRPGTPSSSRSGPGLSSSKPTTSAAAARPSRPPPAGTTRPVAEAAKRAKAARSSAIDPQCEWWSISTLVTTATSGRSFEEAGIALVGLGHHPFPAAPARVGGRAVGAEAGNLAADEEGRIGADRAQCPGRHRRGRRLPVGSGDRQQPLLAAELGQQLTAVADRQAALAGQGQLGVVLADRGRDDRPRRRRGDWRRRGRPAARAPPRAAAPYKRSRCGRCRRPWRRARCRPAPGRSSRLRRSR